MLESPQNLAADIGAATSAGLASVTWIANLNEVLQLVATIVAIGAGLGAGWWHIEQAITTRRKRLNHD